MEPFITTYTGRKVNPLKLRVQDICIEDIAHHQALINRFVGATRRPITLAQHSVYVSRLVHNTQWAREALFHDAAEAYLGDVSKWVKRMPEMSAYRYAEDKAWLIICEALNLNPEGDPALCPMVEWADRLMVRFEAFRESHPSCHMFEIDTHPVPTEEEIEKVGPWAPWTWRQAEVGFLDHARLLGFPGV